MHVYVLAASYIFTIAALLLLLANLFGRQLKAITVFVTFIYFKNSLSQKICLKNMKLQKNDDNKLFSLDVIKQCKASPLQNTVPICNKPIGDTGI